MRPRYDFAATRACLFTIVATFSTASACLAVTRRAPDSYPTIQQGLDAAQTGDTVLVSPGTYSGPNNRNLDFRGKGIVLLAEENDLPVIIDCNSLGRGFWFHSGEVLDAVVQGIKVRNGVGLFDELGGGAVLIAGSSPSLIDCVFEECLGRRYGGGIYIENPSGSNHRPRIHHCVIRSSIVGDTSVSESRGGGLAVSGEGPILSDCVITGNKVVGSSGTEYGGGVSLETGTASVPEVLLSGCTISGNSATIAGGVYIAGAAVLERCIVWGNCATYSWDEISGVGFGLCCATNPAEVYPEFVFIGDQVTTDPLFCDPADCGGAPTVSGIYELQPGSPCRAENSPCGELIGALNTGCEVAASSPAIAVDLTRAITAMPNPTRGACQIILDTSRVTSGGVVIRDVQGRNVAMLITDTESLIEWNGTDEEGRALPPGVYFASVTTSAGVETARIVRIE